MWRSGGNEATVTCIACGTELPRSQAREYDKEGDRWERRGKEFEYLCKDCHGDLCHQPRRGLEQRLVAVADATDDPDQETFAATYYRLAADESGPDRDSEC